MLSFLSQIVLDYAIFFITFVILYFVVAIIAETAQSGTPFGNRFSHAWAPVRLVLFFALLIPFNNGINGAQLITLYTAKWGSGLATNGWIRFNETINDLI